MAREIKRYEMNAGPRQKQLELIIGRKLMFGNLRIDSRREWDFFPLPVVGVEMGASLCFLKMERGFVAGWSRNNGYRVAQKK